MNWLEYNFKNHTGTFFNFSTGQFVVKPRWVFPIVNTCENNVIRYNINISGFKIFEFRYFGTLSILNIINSNLY